MGSELSLVSGNYHENKVSVVMEMASFCLKIRHVFGFTSLKLASLPPVIIQFSVSCTSLGGINIRMLSFRVSNPSEYIYTLRSDPERLRKMQHRVLSGIGIEPTALRFRCSALTN